MPSWKKLISSGSNAHLNAVTASSDIVISQDSKKLMLGADNDLQIYHDGSNNYIDSTTSDQDLYIRGNDGGSMITAARFDMSDAGTLLPNNNLRMGDNQKIRLGTSNDFNLYHDGSDSYIYNDTGGGRIIIQNTTSDGDIEIKVNDSDGNAATNAIIIDTSEVAQIVLPNDNQRLTIGASRDLQFYHSGNINYIRTITQDQDLHFNVNDGGSTITAMKIDSSVSGSVHLPNDNQHLYIGESGDLDLYHYNGNSIIKNTTGQLIIQNTAQDQNIRIQVNDGGTTQTALELRAADKAVRLPYDNQKLMVGDGSDLQFYHDGSNNYIDSITSDQDLYIQVNDGGSTITALQIDASEVGSVLLPNDGQVLKIGASGDLAMYHNGSNSFFYNANVGDLYIQNNVDDKDIILQTDDGAGGVTPYITLDGSAGYTVANKQIRSNDNVALTAGIDGDLNLVHDGTNSYVENWSGDLYIRNNADDGAIRLQSDDGSGGTTNYITLDGQFTSINLLQNTTLAATKRLYLDGGSDTYIFEESADNVIHYVGGQNKLRFNSTGTILNDAGLALDFRVEGDTDPNLFFVDGSTDRVGIGVIDPSSKLEVAGHIRASGVGNGILFDTTGQESSNAIKTINDYETVISNARGYAGFAVVGNSNIRLGFGTNYTNAETALFISHTTGNVGIGTTSPSYELEVAGTGSFAEIVVGGGVFTSASLAAGGSGGGGGSSDITMDGSTANGVLTFGGTDNIDVESNLTFDGTNLDLPDSKKIRLGTSQDLEIYHDGTNSVINNTQTGNLQIYNNVDNGMIELLTDNGSGGTQVFLRADGANNMVRLPVDGVKLTIGDASDLQFYHDGTTNYIRANTTDQDLNFLVNDGGSTITAMSIDTSDVGAVRLPNDGQQLLIGANDDLRLQHNGNHSFIQQYGTGDLYIDNTIDDRSIFFRTDDGTGGVTTYLQIRGDEGQMRANKQLRMQDNVMLQVGSSGDAQFFHNTADTYLQNTTGHLYIQNTADDRDIIVSSDDGSGGITPYITLDGGTGDLLLTPPTRTEIQGNLVVEGDLTAQNYIVSSSITYMTQSFSSGSTIFGDSIDDTHQFTGSIQITGSQSIVGDIEISATNKLYLDGGSDTYISETSADTLKIFVGGSNLLELGEGVTDYVRVLDNTYLGVGSSLDMYMRHDGTNSFLENGTGNLTIRNLTDDGDIILQSDDGSGGTAAYITLDGSAGLTQIDKAMKFTDSTQLQIGNSADAKFYHDGSNTWLDNTGANNFIIQQSGDDQDLIFRCDDGSGGVTSYITLDGSATQTLFYQDTRLQADGKSLSVGANNDLRMIHDTHSYLQNTSTSMLVIQNTGVDQDITFMANDNGSNNHVMRIKGSTGDVGIGTTSPQERLDVVSGSAHIRGVDSEGYVLGLGQFADTPTTPLYKISTFDNTSGGTSGLTSGDHLEIYGTRWGFQNTWARGGQGGAVPVASLYSNAGESRFSIYEALNPTSDGTYSERIRLRGNGDSWITNKLGIGTTSPDTTLDVFSSGVNGILLNQQTSDSNTSARLMFKQDDTTWTMYGAGGNLEFRSGGTVNSSSGTAQFRITENSGVRIPNDNDTLSLGAGEDLYMYHDGSDSFIRNQTGGLYIDQLTDDGNLVLRCDNGSGGTTEYFRLDGSGGYMVASRFMIFTDGQKAEFGNSEDLKIYHDGSNSYIEQGGTGDLYIRQNVDDKDIIFQTDDGSGGVASYITLDGSATTINVAKNMDFADGVRARFGNSGDLQIVHDSGINYIHSAISDMDLMLRVNDGGSNVNAIQLDASDAGTAIFNHDVRVKDNGKLQAGTSGDFQLFHDGTNTSIENLTGALYITNQADDQDIIFRIDDGGTGASEIMRIDASTSQIGIGTDAPGDLLHLYGSGNISMRIQGAGGQANIRYQNDAQSWYAGINSSEQFYWYGSQIAATAGFINTNGNLYWNYNFLANNNNYGLVGRDTGGNTRVVAKINSSNQVQIGDNGHGGNHIHYPANYTEINTDSGYVQIGAQNSSHMHLITDRSNIYTTSYLNVNNGETIRSYSQDFVATRAGSSTNKLVIESTGTRVHNTLKAEDGLYIKAQSNSGTSNTDGRQYLNVFSYKNTGAVTGAFIIHTDIGRASGKMGKIHVHGHAYGQSEVIDFQVVFYMYSGQNGDDGVAGQPYATSITDQGDDGFNKYLGIDADGNLAIAIDEHNGTSKYYYHFTADMYVGNGAYDPVSDWSGSVSTTDGFNWLHKEAVVPKFHFNSTRYKLQTDNGYIEIGPQNSGYAHYKTDRAANYFDKRVVVDQGIVASYDEDLILRRADTNSDYINIQDDRIVSYVGGVEKLRVHNDYFYMPNKIYGGDGSAATPMYNFWNDSDTGMFRSAADTIGFSTGGSSRFTMNGSGVFYASSAIQAGNAGVQIWDATHGFKTVLAKDSTYTKLLNNDGAVCAYFGDSADRSNYFDSTNHRFRSGDGGTYFGILNSTGLRLGTGNTSATTRLDVDGTSRFTGEMYIAHGGSDYAPGINFMGGTNAPGSNTYENAKFAYYDNSGTGFMRHTIGRSAGAYEWYIGGTRMFSFDQSGNLALRNDGSSQGASIQRVGQIQFTWDRDTYGNSNNHAIVCDSDNLIINSFDDVTINIDSNSNDAAETFDVRRHSTSLTGGELLFQVHGEYVYPAKQLRMIDGSAAAPAMSFSTDPDLGFYRNGANNMRFSAGNSIRGTWNGDGLVLNGGSLGVNVAVSTAADGRIDAGNDIVAFSSDKRLKQNIRFIENPLEKISQLSGFVYNWNELANKEAGYDMDKDYVGVFAQDVEKVQPEAVKIAPFDNDGEDNSKSGENYLTVQYEKMVPLLIESIKELKSIVETQQTTIEKQQQRLTKLEEKSNG